MRWPKIHSERRLDEARIELMQALDPFPSLATPSLLVVGEPRALERRLRAVEFFMHSDPVVVPANSHQGIVSVF